MDTLLLPKVSVIVVNYNYEHYLEKAVDSIVAQTYPNIEIIVVDDKSTDNSRTVIDRICEKHSDIIPIKLDVNGGQSVASMRGLAVATGAYLVFVDADDQLLPECVETHIYTHLSSRIPVAFTSVDVLNSVSGQDVNLSLSGFSQYIQGRHGGRPHAIGRVDKRLPSSWFGQRKPPVDVEQMHFVLPPYVDPYVWSPTSANCFRKDAVALLLREPGDAFVRWGTDAYLIRPLSALFGSILIDAPLMRYVIHTNNRFTKSAPLNNRLSFDALSTKDDMRDMVRLAVKRFMADVASDGGQYPRPHEFFDAMKALSGCWPGPKPGEATDEFYLKQLVDNQTSLVTGFGEQVVADEFRRQKTLSSFLKKAGGMLRVPGAAG